MVYIRHDSEHGDGVVMTPTGERPPNSVPWPLWHTLGAVQLGLAKEITREEAEALTGEKSDQEHHNQRTGLTEEQGV